MSWVGYAWYDKPFDGTKAQKAKNFVSHDWADSEELSPFDNKTVIMVCLSCGAKTSNERSYYKCGTRVPRVTLKEYLELKSPES
jgi:hypothetical protein